MTRHHDEPPRTDLLTRASRRADLLDADEERALLRAAQRGDARAIERVVVAHVRVVLALVPSFRRAGLSHDDLVSEGVLGLLEAVRRFDCARDNRFAAYARWWVSARLRRFVGTSRHVVTPPSTRVARRAQQRYGRVAHLESQRLGRTPTRDEMARALGTSADDLAAVESTLSTFTSSLTDAASGAQLDLAAEAPSAEQALDEARIGSVRRARVEAALATLSPRERLVLLRRFADDEPASLAELGTELSVSRERVRQVQERAREKLRAQLATAPGVRP